MIRTYDKANRFFEFFNPGTGMYVRTGIIGEDGKDTGVDPFMRSFPALIDIGIMGRCVCAKQCKVDCYQKAIDRTGRNMSVEDYTEIMKQCNGKVFQVALGGAGDPDTHENFEDIMRITRKYGIVPNFTTSGVAFTEYKAEVCKELAGAIAVSEHNADYTMRTINLLLDKGIKTNVHYVLSNQSIDQATQRLNDNYYGDLNAVVFLLYKPIGLGRMEKVLQPDDPRLAKFFEAVEAKKYTHKVGFDSCTIPGIINHTTKIDIASLDTCEAARFSMYIDADMNAMPCSFGNQNPAYFVSLRNHTIQQAWDSEVFNDFRSHLSESCPKCPNRATCGGGCPITRDIVLCNLPTKDCR